MDIIYLLKFFNWCSILTGNGSIQFIQRTWMLMSYAWRIVLTSIFIINIYNGNKWIVKHVLDILEPISIVLIVSVELRLLGPLFSIIWRFYFDNELSNMLKKFMNTLDVLKQLNTEVILKTKIFWICIAGLLAHFMLYIISVTGFLIKVPKYSIFNWVLWSFVFIYNNWMFYEYMFLIMFVQIIVCKLNDEISKGIIPISDLSSMYTNTLESLDVINRSIVGAPVLINIILRNLSSIIYVLYHYVLFKGMFVKVDVHSFYPILDVSMRLFDVAALCYLCQTTENEIRWTTFILNKRSITANPTLRRKIAFFSLRRLHADFRFELCRFYRINIRQLLTLLFKTTIFLIIQIQFNLNNIYQAFKNVN